MFLDTERQQIAPAHELGARSVDKLARVRLRDGREEWLWVHVEVQAQPEREFAQRIWAYYCRIWDRFSQQVVTLAVLADDQPGWCPSVYHVELVGCVQHFEFPVFKVLECADAAGCFERTANPFALVVAAHQVALATRQDASARCAGRFRLVRYLYWHGLDWQRVLHLFRVIGWLTRLPREWELRFREEVPRLEQSDEGMTIDSLLTPIELMADERGHKRGLQEGVQEGRQEQARRAVLEVLETRFGAVPGEVVEKVQAVSDSDRLRQMHRRAVTSPSVADFLAGA